MQSYSSFSANSQRGMRHLNLALSWLVPHVLFAWPLTATPSHQQCPLFGERAACELGFWTNGDTKAASCVGCPPGTFYPTDTVNTTCTLCPPGTLNDVRAKAVKPQRSAHRLWDQDTQLGFCFVGSCIILKLAVLAPTFVRFACREGSYMA